MKKIDVNKSLIFRKNVEDAKNSLEYLDQEGYFSNSKDFSVYTEGYLDVVEVANFIFIPYSYIKNGDRHVFEYFIPKSKAVFVEEEPKKKTLRPFKSIAEFFAVTGFGIGDVVKFGDHTYEEKSIFTGFRVYTDEEFHKINVILGGSIHSFDDLFKHFKYYKNGEWLRFGVEE